MKRRFSIVLVLVGVLGAASAPGAAASGWSIQRTPSRANLSGGVLSGVSCASKSACTAVGDYFNGTTYLTLAERWNGTNWSIKSTPNPAGATQSELQGVSCTSRSACTAVGHYYNGTTNLTLAERWNGTSWSIESTPNPTGATGNIYLNGVACTSESVCTAVGYYYGTTYLTLAERWNGTSWSIESTPNPTGGHDAALDGVSCTSKTACTAVGDSSYKGTLAERWNGAKWSIQHTPPALDSGSLGGVSCTSGRACTAVGPVGTTATGSITLAEHWNGTKWSVQHTPNAPSLNDELFGVSCTSASACTAVGQLVLRQSGG